jgi:hypothetical protein
MGEMRSVARGEAVRRDTHDILTALLRTRPPQTPFYRPPNHTRECAYKIHACVCVEGGGGGRHAGARRRCRGWRRAHSGGMPPRTARSHTAPAHAHTRTPADRRQDTRKKSNRSTDMSRATRGSIVAAAASAASAAAATTARVPIARFVDTAAARSIECDGGCKRGVDVPLQMKCGQSARHARRGAAQRRHAHCGSAHSHMLSPKQEHDIHRIEAPHMHTCMLLYTAGRKRRGAYS